MRSSTYKRKISCVFLIQFQFLDQFNLSIDVVQHFQVTSIAIRTASLPLSTIRMPLKGVVDSNPYACFLQSWRRTSTFLWDLIAPDAWCRNREIRYVFIPQYSSCNGLIVWSNQAKTKGKQKYKLDHMICISWQTLHYKMRNWLQPTFQVIGCLADMEKSQKPEI